MALEKSKENLWQAWSNIDAGIQQFVTELLTPSKSVGLVEVPLEHQGWHPDNWDKQNTTWNWGMVNLGCPKASKAPGL